MVDKFAGPSFQDDCSEESHVNFQFPLPSSLETARVQLVPFKLEIHGEAFISLYKASPEVARYLPVDFDDYQAFASWFESFIVFNTGNVIFAIIDKTKGDAHILQRLAGIVGLLGCSPSNRVAEIGPVIIFSEYQRTFISSNTLGLVLQYLLNVPSANGLGFRRVAWTTNTNNQASIKAAERFGFQKEGVIRWAWCLPPSATIGKSCPEERGPALGRDSLLLSLCWDDWENGCKELAESLIQRLV